MEDALEKALTRVERHRDKMISKLEAKRQKKVTELREISVAIQRLRGQRSRRAVPRTTIEDHIVDVLRGAGKPLTVTEIREQAGCTQNTIYQPLGRLENSGKIRRIQQPIGRTYELAEASGGE